MPNCLLIVDHSSEIISWAWDMARTSTLNAGRVNSRTEIGQFEVSVEINQKRSDLRSALQGTPNRIQMGNFNGILSGLSITSGAYPIISDPYPVYCPG